MTAINVADFFVATIQGFLVSALVCKNFKTQYKYGISLIMHMAGLEISYVIMNYGIFQYGLRVLFGTSCFIVMNFLIFEGTSMWKVLLGIGEYGFLIVVDFFNYLFINPWMGLSFEGDMLISLRLLLGRTMYNVLIYLVLTIAELWKNRKRGRRFVIVALLSIIFGACQLFIMKNQYQANASGLTESAVIISIFYSGIVILGYFVVMELFEQIVSQQKRQAELEQMALEKQYQYDYYKKAYEQGEQLRDLRHDMRNQLQAVEFLLRSGD